MMSIKKLWFLFLLVFILCIVFLTAIDFLTNTFSLTISWFSFFIIVDRVYQLSKIFSIDIFTSIFFQKTHAIFLISKSYNKSAPWLKFGIWLWKINLFMWEDIKIEKLGMRLKLFRNVNNKADSSLTCWLLSLNLDIFPLMRIKNIFLSLTSSSKLSCKYYSASFSVYLGCPPICLRLRLMYVCFSHPCHLHLVCVCLGRLRRFQCLFRKNED